jgi:hypothetical protein
MAADDPRATNLYELRPASAQQRSGAAPGGGSPGLLGREEPLMAFSADRVVWLNLRPRVSKVAGGAYLPVAGSVSVSGRVRWSPMRVGPLAAGSHWNRVKTFGGWVMTAKGVAACTVPNVCSCEVPLPALVARHRDNRTGCRRCGKPLREG